MFPGTENQPIVRMIARGLIAAIAFAIVGFAADILRSTYSGIRVYPSEFLTIVGLAAISLSVTLILEWSTLTLLQPRSQISNAAGRTALEVEQCVKDLTANWLYFRKNLKFKEGVPLADIVSTFAIPSREFVRQRYPVLSSQSDEIFWSMVRKAIIFSGSDMSLAVYKAIEIARQRQN